MSKIVMMMSVSVDGYFAGPEGELDWHLVDDELHAHFNELLRGMAAFLGGRVTYELMAGFWPTADEDPASTATMAEFARIWREMPKIVYSRTLQHAGWNTTVVRDVVPAEVRRLAANSPPPHVRQRRRPAALRALSRGPSPSLTRRRSRSVPHAPSLTRSRLDLAGGRCSRRSGSRPRCPPWTSPMIPVRAL
jgi:dihydrofolate reductase